MAAPSVEESDLLERCLQGDADAWNALFDRHYAAAGRFIFQLSHQFSREDVDEICQETFLSVIRNLSSFQGQCQFQTWLFRIASNKARDFKERQSATKRGGKAVTLSLDKPHPETGLTLDPPSRGPGPDAALLREENVALVGAAMDHLGHDCREIIELRYFADLSYDDISKALSLNPKTVSSRLSKCLDKLEAILKRLLSRETKPSAPV